MLIFPEECSSILDWIRWGASSLAANDVANVNGQLDSIAEAQSLIAYCLNLDFNSLDTIYLNAKLTKIEQESIFEIITKRINTKKPTAYLINQAWFAGLSFYVDERVLVPRSPIGELIETNFSPWVDYSNINNILDLCTGSGCIAISCAYGFEGVQVDGVDLSPDALEVAKINQKQHGVEDFVNFHLGDLFDPVLGKKYDLIVSNPPYVDEIDMLNLPDEIKHEPAIGLASGADGLDVTTRILHQASDYLNDGGVLIVEVGNSAQALSDKYPDTDFMWLDFKNGGHGVFLLTKQQLKKFNSSYNFNVL